MSASQSKKTNSDKRRRRKRNPPESTHRIFLKYQEFASQNSEKKLELTFIENDYTSALANDPSADDA